MKDTNTPHRQWAACKRILVVKPDTRGDLLMSIPAIRALKQTFGCEITMLTNNSGAALTASIPEIDDTIIFNAPWQQTGHTADFDEMVETLRDEEFDGAVLFTVYSQNPMPLAMLVYLAGIPLRLGYCREQPDNLLTTWEPEKEPYEYIRHQVRRDLDLVSSIGAYTADEQLKLQVEESLWPSLQSRLTAAGIDTEKPWIVLQPDDQHLYPEGEWTAVTEKLAATLQCQFVYTDGFDIDELIVLIAHARLVIAVNAGITHMAAATATPLIVICALTDTQHTPWSVHSKVVYFDVPEKSRSRNEVERFAYHISAQKMLPPATPESIAALAAGLFDQSDVDSTVTPGHNPGLLSRQ